VARRRAARLLWGTALTLFLLLAVKFFLADVYEVKSDSMRPTIFGGTAPQADEAFNEWVLVVYEKAPELERFDLVVSRPGGGGGNPIVKRAAALPGERVLIADGDLLIEGERLPADAERPPPIVVFDDRLQEIERYFHFADEVWSGSGNEWIADAEAVRRDSDRGMMLFQKKLRDDYIDEERSRVTGLAKANDAIVECEARLDPAHDPARARLRLRLVEEGDTFEAHVEPDQGPDAAGGFRYRILRRKPQVGFAVLREGSLPFRAGTWHRLRFANVDNHLSLRLDDDFEAVVSYEANVVLESHDNVPLLDEDEDSTPYGPRVSFGAEGCRAGFRSIVVLRDLVYTGLGEFAVVAPLSLGPDEYLLLGDNSSRSRDSREFGPVHAADVVGRPVAVVWPLSRARWLR